MAESVYKLHYAGVSHLISEADAVRLKAWTGDALVIDIEQGKGKTLSIALGPGIPFAVTSQPKQSSQVRVLR